MKNNEIIVTVTSDMELQNSYGEEMGQFINNLSQYARIFDKSIHVYGDDSEYVLLHLKCQQDFANNKLKCKGYLFLNEVYEMLNLPKTKIGAIVGWIYDEKNPVGDNFVDFGIFQLHNKDAVNGVSSTFILDFNVDGEILSRI